ncbi:MAG: FAD-dependent oxidoreductase, partial [Flavobacteriales bacterium]|nr:FAD-dependent oxidoreductase [Flavobacteriales bacterium]
QKVCGVQLRDVKSGEEISVSAKQIVNATGPWVDLLRDKDHSKKGKQLFLSKGVHLVVRHERLPVKQTVYFDNTDGRMIFAIPRGRITYIGTTDTPYEGGKEEPGTTKADVDYILEAVNQMFPSVKLQAEDVESSWSGLRPLIHEEGKSASEMSRKDEIFDSPSGLISIAGGKLTGYRKMAERVVDRVVQQGAFKTKANSTATQELEDAAFASYAEVQALVDRLFTEYPKLLPDFKSAEYLVHNYGSASESILQAAQKIELPAELALAAAEGDHCVQNEMTLDLLDFFERRTGRLYFDILSIPRIRQVVSMVFAKFYGWDEATSRAQESLLDEAMSRVRTW